ncbi:MAG: hypothetical protein Q8M79_00140 [Dehalococcoidia bacterium]|nr:hypothetical protein [Dehalococcoidia bacterium]
MTTDDEQQPAGEGAPPEAETPAGPASQPDSQPAAEPQPLPEATPEVVEPPRGLFGRMMRRDEAAPEPTATTAAVEPEPLDAPPPDALPEVVEAPRGLFARVMRRGPRAETPAVSGDAEPEALALPADESTAGIPLRPARIVEPAAVEPPPTSPPGPRIETRESIVRGPRPVLPTPPIEQTPTPDTPAVGTPNLEGVTAAEAAALEAPVVALPATEGDGAGEPVEPAAPVEAPVEAEPYVPVVPSIHRPVPVSAHMAVITGLATFVTLAFVLIEPSPRWWLLLGAAAVIFGMDGVLRAAWRHPFEAGQETAPFLFLPALYILAVPVLIEHNARGEWALPLALVGGLGFGVLTWGEVASVRVSAVEYPRARLVTTSVAYFTAFAFFSLTYVFQVGLFPAMVAVGLASTMLSVELLREGEIDPLETLGFALVSGLVVAEGRWVIHYLPLDRYMAGLALLVVFYFTTGVVHSYITRQFTPRLAIEYGGISAAALALVVLARAGGLA